MNRDELERSWTITRAHLANAKAALQVCLDRPEALAAYDDYLDHNELELALDELEALADDVMVSDTFWQELLWATENMGLTSHAERYRLRNG